MDETYYRDDILRSISLLERAALVAIAGVGVGALAGFFVGLRLGRRWTVA